MRASLVLTVLTCVLTLPLSASFAAKVGETCDGIAAMKDCGVSIPPANAA